MCRNCRRGDIDRVLAPIAGLVADVLLLLTCALGLGPRGRGREVRARGSRCRGRRRAGARRRLIPELRLVVTLLVLVLPLIVSRFSLLAGRSALRAGGLGLARGSGRAGRRTEGGTRARTDLGKPDARCGGERETDDRPDHRAPGQAAESSTHGEFLAFLGGVLAAYGKVSPSTPKTCAALTHSSERRRIRPCEPREAQGPNSPSSRAKQRARRLIGPGEPRRR